MGGGAAHMDRDSHCPFDVVWEIEGVDEGLGAG